LQGWGGKKTLYTIKGTKHFPAGLGVNVNAVGAGGGQKPGKGSLRRGGVGSEQGGGKGHPRGMHQISNKGAPWLEQ